MSIEAIQATSAGKAFFSPSVPKSRKRTAAPSMSRNLMIDMSYNVTGRARESQTTCWPKGGPTRKSPLA